MTAAAMGPSAGRGARAPGASSLAVGAALAVIYAYGACRTIYVGDSGELVAAVHTLGIPHPSGYPLYVLLGKLWTLAVPVGSVAFRMSLFSGACAAGACALVHRTARRLGAGEVAALTGAGLLAFAPSFWSQATIQRVYSLNALMMMAATAAAVEWRLGRQDRWLVAAFLLSGLGASNHTYMFLFGVALGLWALAVDPGLLRRWRSGAACVVAAVLGCAPYAYMPIRSRADPRLDWGNPETGSSLLAAVTRADFWDRRWYESPADLLTVALDYARGLGEELAWVGTALAVLGVVTAVAGGRSRDGASPGGPAGDPARAWPVGLAALAMLANYGSMALHGSRSDLFLWHRYYLPSYAMAALLATAGAEALLARLPAAMPRPLRAAPLLIPLAMATLGWAEHDRHRYRVADDFSRTLLASLPPGAHLSASDDNILFALIYLQLVEGLRPDVDLILQGVGDADLPPLRFDPDDDPLYFTHHPNWSLAEIDVVPVGLVFRVARRDGPLPAPALPGRPLAGEDDPRVPRDYLTRNLIGHYHYMHGITFENRDWPAAAAAFRRAAAIADGNDVLLYNLGLIYHRNGRFEDALSFFERSHAINDRHLASSSEVRASDKIEQLRAELARVEPLEAELRRTLSPPEGEGAVAEARADLALASALEERGESLRARKWVRDAEALLRLPKQSEAPTLRGAGRSFGGTAD